MTSKKESDAFKKLSEMTNVSNAERPKSTAAPGSLQTDPAATPTPTIMPKYEQLNEMNEDMHGWIKIEGTEIDYPVMWTPDDAEFYLHRDFEKNYSFRGVPFIGAGYSEGTPNTMIYGHNMLNGSMFASLLKYEDNAFYTLHPTIQYDTRYEEGEYQIIAAFRTQLYFNIEDDAFVYYHYYNIATQEQFDEYVSACKAASIYDTGVTAEWGDTLITLSTCAYHTSNGRFVVVAKKLPPQNAW